MDMGLFSVCLKVMLGRMCDVPLSTVRTILLVKGKTVFAALTGLLETMIWFLVVREAISTEIGGFFVALFYGGGFAIGTLLGGLLAKKFISGSVEAQIVIDKKNAGIIPKIRENGFGVSVVNVNESEYGEGKHMLFIELDENRLPELRRLIKKLDEHAFMIVKETKFYQNGFFVRK